MARCQVCPSSCDPHRDEKTTSERQTAKTRRSAPPNEVDLVVMQAMIAINQNVFKHLRQFSLDRLKISSAGMFPAPGRTLGDACLNDAFDLAISRPGHESPVSLPA